MHEFFSWFNFSEFVVLLVYLFFVQLCVKILHFCKCLDCVLMLIMFAEFGSLSGKSGQYIGILG